MNIIWPLDVCIVGLWPHQPGDIDYGPVQGEIALLACSSSSVC